MQGFVCKLISLKKKPTTQPYVWLQDSAAPDMDRNHSCIHDQISALLGNQEEEIHCSLWNKGYCREPLPFKSQAQANRWCPFFIFAPFFPSSPKLTANNGKKLLLPPEMNDSTSFLPPIHTHTQRAFHQSTSDLAPHLISKFPPSAVS